MEKQSVRIRRESAQAVVIDVQERLFPVMNNPESLERRLRILLEGLKILEIPRICTEQYPRGLGKTLNSVTSLLEGVPVLEKVSFSCLGAPGFPEHLDGERRQVILCGIETHVCVLQTALDLLERGFVPVVCRDAVDSRNPEDKETALSRILRSGGIVTTTESLLFELLETAGRDPFRAISSLIK